MRPILIVERVKPHLKILIVCGFKINAPDPPYPEQVAAVVRIVVVVKVRRLWYELAAKRSLFVTEKESTRLPNRHETSSLSLL